MTLARAFSNTFAGIRPQDVPAFITAQLAGALVATGLFKWLMPSDLAKEAPNVLIPHSTDVGSNGMKTYIFTCVHNAGRSQMAAAFFNVYAGSGCRALSAGTNPAAHVHPEVIEVMHEIGIDLSKARSRKLTKELAQGASALVTMGCGESCPFVPGMRIVDWSIPDPKGQPLERVREIRDRLHEEVRRLIREDCADCCDPVAVT